MRIAVISDLHLGRGDATDPFGHRDEQFLRFLDFLEAEFERVVLLGDVYELLRGPLPGSALDELRACREAHPEIARRLESARYLYLHGNHDMAAREALGAPEELVLDTGGARVLLTHGHRYDWILRRAQSLAELGVWVGGWMMRLGMRPLYRALERMDQESRASADPEACGFRRWAVEFARAREVDVVVTGHTHLPARSHHGDQLFLNAGTCSDGRFSFLEIDPGRGNFTLQEGWSP